MKFAIGSVLHETIREMEAWVLFPYPFLLLKNVEGISKHFIVKVYPPIANKSEI
jgi:hypothetical protein